jgi:UDPglucose--hexose-1-phosphate uridylyltransferase
MSDIRFERFEDTFELLNPLKGFGKAIQTVEVRRDPLLGHTSIYNAAIEDKVKMFVGDGDRFLVERLAAESEMHCFFCPGRIDKVARFPAELVPEGTISLGETVLFPNLFALGKYHAVAAVSRSHFLTLHDFTPELIRDAFLAMRSLVSAVYRQDANAVYVNANANYLFPAGASMMHPHFQLLITPLPYTQQAHLSRACRDYFGSQGTSYHQDLLECERARGERYIARTDAWHWLCAYAPLGSNEILGVHESCGDFAQLTDRDLAALGQGLSATLRLFDSLGHMSFNFTLYARRDPGTTDGFNCLIRCITRQNPYPHYRTDDFFLQKGLQTELILHLPEALASNARPFFP